MAEGPVGRGLFTSETADPNWRKAHNVLLPAFSMDAMRGYYPRMLDIAVQLALKWERLNSGRHGGRAGRHDAAHAGHDCTLRLQLPVQLLLPRNTRTPSWSPCLGVLEAAQAQSRELPIQRRLNRKRARELRAHQELMVSTVRAHHRGTARVRRTGTFNDLLDRMLTGVDRQSGEKLDDTNIIAQCITFLIAGHETTSGLLSFALYALLKNPDVLARAYDEVDRVLGTDLSVLPTYAQIHQAAVRRADPRRDAAAVAHGAGVHAPPV